MQHFVFPSYILLTCLYLAIVVFAPSLALSQVTGLQVADLEFLDKRGKNLASPCLQILATHSGQEPLSFVSGRPGYFGHISFNKLLHLPWRY